MEYKSNTIYHIFNQGNNKQKIFFTPDNYRYFKQKIEHYIQPYADILAYCLMPNHFHLLVKTNELACKESRATKPCAKKDLERLGVLSTLKQTENISQEVLPSRQNNLSHAIGTMLSAYARAINKQEQRSGSLFRSRTKSNDGSKETLVTIDKGDHDFFLPLHAFWQTCFDYIHDNPVKANLAADRQQWTYSSYNEFLNPSSGDIVNHKLVNDLELVWK